MNFDIESRTILRVRSGSHAYGTNNADSDLDIKGVCIEPIKNQLGFLHHFEQREKMVSNGHPYDEVIYSLKKFAKLATDCNPNIIEVLWVDESDVLFETVHGKRLRDIRSDFLSKKARHTFSGYAISQLKRINTHRRWLLNPPTHIPTRKEFDLPDQTLISHDQLLAAQSAVQKKLDEWSMRELENFDNSQRQTIRTEFNRLLSEITAWSEHELSTKMYDAALSLLGFNDNFIEHLRKESKYKVAKTDWQHYQKWLTDRNPRRAELEKKHLYDVKHAYHLVRLMRMCKEILEQQQVFVKRHDRDELLAIRNGEWTYEKLVEYAQKLDDECDVLYRTSLLRNKPDQVKVNDFIVELTMEFEQR